MKKNGRIYAGPIDPKAREELSEIQSVGEPDVYLALAAIFLETSDEFERALSEAGSKRHVEELQNIAHSWKSSAYSIGALELGGLCLRLEQSAGDPAVFIDEIQAEYFRVKLALTDIIRAG